MGVLVKPQADQTDGILRRIDVTPETAGWHYISLFDETVAVHDGDLALVPRGYHTVVALPRCDLYYLNVMADSHRAWNYQVDTAFHRLLSPSGKVTGEIVRPSTMAE